MPGSASDNGRTAGAGGTASVISKCLEIRGGVAHVACLDVSLCARIGAIGAALAALSSPPMEPITLVLMPGLDGTGEQFAPLLRELPDSLVPLVVRYPRDRALDYDALLPIVVAQLPQNAPFVLLGESFSGPLAIRIASQQPSGLCALVLVATFHRRPVSSWLALGKTFARGPVFSRPPPAFVIRQMLAGRDAPDALVRGFQASSASVRSDVLALRVRAALEVDVSSALAEVRVPIVYFAARHDALVRAAIPDEMRALVPSLEVHSFATPHLLLQRQPREAAAALAEFAARAIVRS